MKIYKHNITESEAEKREYFSYDYDLVDTVKYIISSLSHLNTDIHLFWDDNIPESLQNSYFDVSEGALCALCGDFFISTTEIDFYVSNSNEIYSGMRKSQGYYQNLKFGIYENTLTKKHFDAGSVVFVAEINDSGAWCSIPVIIKTVEKYCVKLVDETLRSNSVVFHTEKECNDFLRGVIN